MQKEIGHEFWYVDKYNLTIDKWKVVGGKGFTYPCVNEEGKTGSFNLTGPDTFESEKEALEKFREYLGLELAEKQEHIIAVRKDIDETISKGAKAEARIQEINEQEEIEKFGGWIPASKPPDNGRVILIYIPNRQTSSIISGYYGIFTREFYTYPGNLAQYISHWKELPEGPKINEQI